MNRSCLALLAASLLLTASISAAAAEDSTSFEKKNFNYSEWAKGRFSEVVSVKNPGRLLFLGGIGAEDEAATTGGAIKYLGDVGAQCRYAWDKIKRLLENAGQLVERRRQGDDLCDRHPLFRRRWEMSGRSFRRFAAAGRDLRGD